MTEEFLHFIWKFKMKDQTFRTLQGNEVVIIRHGEHNRDAGPDFLNTMIRIDSTLWAGNVEIHVRSSDWFRHRHDLDLSYDNVILHLVFEHDQTVTRKNGEEIPELVICDQVDPCLFETYQYFLNNHLWIPCALSLNVIDPLVLSNWLEVLSIERLELKYHNVLKILEFNNNDWNQAFYQALSGTFGFRINKEPFEMLARNTPVRFIEKHKDSLLQVEALLFGQAGLLERDYKDDYAEKLKKEYLHLKNKFSLQKISGHLWKFLRLRPNNFPTIRIAQLAMLLYLHENLFGKIIDSRDIIMIRNLFKVSASSYWHEHYRFDKLSASIPKKMSDQTIDLVMINNIIPFIFAYGKLKNRVSDQELALKLLSEIQPESNSIIRNFAKFGVDAKNAADSQALLELKNSYCDQKRCLDCRLAINFIK